MERSTGRKVVMAICVAVIVLGVTTLGLYLGGAFPKISNLFSPEEPTEQIVNTPSVYITNVEGPYGGMSAVVLEKGTDYTELDSAFSAVSDIASWGFNTVVFSGCDLSEAAQLATQAKNSNLFSVYMIGSDTIVKSGVVDDQAASSLSGTGVDSILIAAADGAAINEVANAAKAIRSTDDTIYLGVYAKAEKQYAPVCSADVFDYKYIDITVPTSSVAGDYTEYLSAYSDGTTKDNVFCIHTELVGNSKGYDKPEEIMKQFASAAMVASSGYSFYRYGALNENDELRGAIIEYMNSGIMKDFFKELIISSPKKDKFETNQSRISFVGTGDISKPLTVNGKTVTMVDDGYFSLEENLKPGENVFVFEHNGKKITYTITYKMKLINSVSPQGNVSAPGATVLDVIAEAHKSASVTATLNGMSVKLVRSDDYSDGDSADEGSDYTTFVGSFTLPESGAADKNLGSVKITASYQGLTESKTAASVVVNAKQVFVPPSENLTTFPTDTVPATTIPSLEDVTGESDESVVTNPTTTTTTQKPSSTTPPKIFELLTPYKNNGVSGKSKMIVVKNDYSETLPATTMNDVSVPYFTALPKGTIDYVVNTSSFDGIQYYVLASGRRVYKKDVEYLSSGYNMPSNEIRTVGVSKESDETKITLTMRWKVPFNVREYPQSFYTQTEGRPYSIKNYTAEYVDIVFFHTTKVDTAPSINSSVISKAQWIKNSDGSVTLRLSLKKKGGFYGIKYYYNSDGTLTLSVKERTNTSLSGKVIMLDPGHGGNDPGAIGTAIVGNRNVYEETINIAIANKVKAKLEAMGAKVIMTRNSSSKTLDLDSRAALCRANNPDVFIAIHCDASSTSSSASGTTAYYYKGYSYPLANYLSDSIVYAYKNEIYANNSAMASKVDKGTKFKGFRVTRVEECPSVLIEYGFVTNVTECNALVSDKNQNALAQATVNGLVNYFKNS